MHQTNTGLVIFDCSKENFYNHAFHEACLIKFLTEELMRDKKASLERVDLMKEAARCVICYRQS